MGDVGGPSGIIVTLEHTLAGADAAVRLAALMGWPVATGCFDLEPLESGWTFKRRLHGGALVGTFRIDSGPFVVTLETDRPPKPSAGRELASAERVVAGGRGIGGPEGFERLRELADSLDAALAASRPPCDSGWVPSNHQVGITGTRVRPDLYVAIGISGSVQHLAGMHRAGCIVAINKDPEAPIFRYAHIGVVGDWAEVVDGILDGLDTGPDRREATA